MEESMKKEQVSLINELIQGKELAKQLCHHLLSSFPSSHETNEFLIDKILSSYEKALTMLNWESNMGDSKTTNGSDMIDSYGSFANGSPKSEVFDQEFKHKAVSKKRKTMPRWTEQMKVCLEKGPEGSLDDGYAWRKYGQKDILGAKFPRAYYRCTHRNVQGCLATKQVQRSDEDPTIFEVTYRGRHTCTQAKHSSKGFPKKIKMGLLQNQLHNDQNNQNNQSKQEKKEEAREGILSYEAELEVKPEDLEANEDIFPWFCFDYPSAGSENEDNNMLSEMLMENHFMESFSPASESNILCLLPCQFQNVQTSESDITDMVSVSVSAPTSVTNSPILDLDVFLDNGDFDTDFPLNNPEYFSS